MQCGGHSPPYALKWIVFFGCQSRVAKIGRPALANLSIEAFSRGTTASPPVTASAPPGQKSFCTSTITSASLPCIDSDYMEDNLVARKGARRQRSPLSISYAVFCLKKQHKQYATPGIVDGRIKIRPTRRGTLA